MQIIKKVKYWLTGISISREYVPVAISQEFPVKVFVKKDGEDMFEELDNRKYVFLGFKPLILGIDGKACPDLASSNSIRIYFRLPNPPSRVPGSLAVLSLKKVKRVNLPTGEICLFEGESASQVFMNGVHWIVHRIRNFFRSETGNVKPSGALYDQLIAAYSIPRPLSLVTVAIDGKANFFPVDLDGEFTQDCYAIGLRKGGKSTKQVELIRKVVVARLDPKAHEFVFALGKNHLADLAPLSGENDNIYSRVFNFPLPSWAISYTELELIKTVEHGIHEIHFFSIQNSEIVSRKEPLGLLHRICLQWYLKNIDVSSTTIQL